MAYARILLPILLATCGFPGFAEENSIPVVSVFDENGMVPGIEIPFVVGPQLKNGSFHIDSVRIVKSDACQVRRDRFRVNLFLLKCASAETVKFELAGRIGDRIYKFETQPYRVFEVANGFRPREDMRLNLEGVQ